MTEQATFEFRNRLGAPDSKDRRNKAKWTEAKRQVRKFLELRCRGKAAASRSGVIRKHAGLPPSLTEEIVREVIRELLEEGVPIGSCVKGYFIIESMEELRKVIDGLRARQQGIETRIQLISAAYGLEGVMDEKAEDDQRS